MRKAMSAFFAVATLVGCSDPAAKPADSTANATTQTPALQYDQRGLPSIEGRQVEPSAGDAAEAAEARALPGSRGSHQKAFDDGVPLLPSDHLASKSQNKLQLMSAAPVRVCIDVDGVAKFGDQCPEGGGGGNPPAGDPPGNPPGGGNCEEGERKKVCAEACATATAQAYAFAFAHASATACAWASAFACVWSRDPFAQVCAWAQSSACSTAFATAFGFGFAVDTQTVCNKQCAE